jgi:monoterpene epsilon-lactone hydrolase
MLAIAASHEILRDDTVRFGEKAKAAGVDITVELYDDAIHAWTLFAGLIPEADAAVARIGTFVDAQLA